MYPKWMYHPCQAPTIIYSKEQEDKLAAGWSDTFVECAPGPQATESESVPAKAEVEAKPTEKPKATSRKGAKA